MLAETKEEQAPRGEHEVEEGVEDVTNKTILQFRDVCEGGTTDYIVPRPDVFDISYEAKMDISQWVTRPIRLYEGNWTVGSYLNTSFQPWALMFDSLSIREKLYHYNLFRADLVLTAKINGTPFHYGRLLVSYRPLSGRQTIDNTLHPGTDTDIPRFSQMPHIMLNPTLSEGGELKVPYFAPQPWIDLSNNNTFDLLGVIFLNSFQTLKHANGGTDPVSIAIFGHFENVSMSAATTYKVQSEYGKGIVSATASNVAKAANVLTSVPLLKPYAKATEYAATKVSQIARIFGFSRPAVLDNLQPYVPKMIGNIANVDADEVVHKLSYDSKNELTVDPSVVGLPRDDQMSFNYLKRRWSYVTQFLWAKADVSDDLLFASRVSPTMIPRDNDDLRPSPLAFISIPFQFWRGIIEYRFQVVCSAYHKGKIRIVYDPCCFTGVAADSFNTATNWIIDITEETELVVSIPWMAPLAYRDVRAVDLVNYTQNNEYGTNSEYNNSSASSNGSFAIYVLNDLTTPDSVVNNDISVNVWIRGGEDFEVMGANVSNLHDFSYFGVQSLINTEAPNTLNLTYGGERMVSLRALLKRYNLHSVEHFVSTSNNEVVEHNVMMPAMPYQKGADPVGVDTAAGPIPYNFCNMTLLNYFTPAYVGWRGSLRRKLVMVGSDTHAPTAGILQATRINIGSPSYVRGDFLYSAVANSVSANHRQAIAFTDRTGRSGTGLASVAGKGCLEYELPYYSSRLFCAAGRIGIDDAANFDGSERQWTSESVVISSRRDVEFQRWVSTGEDFSLLWFINVPSIHMAALPAAV